MTVHKAIAPSYAELRPLRPPVSDRFPVYLNLVPDLVDAKDHPDNTVAHALAVCAGYSYSTADTVAMIMARMGLERNHCLMVGQYVDAMFISSTSFVVQSRDGRVVVLGYRGTEPLNFVTWLTDFDVDPDRVEFRFGESAGEYDVHAGFYRNVRSTRWKVIAALQRALQGRSVLDDGGPGPDLPDGGRMPHPMEALYITGHSLGGAMAALMSMMLVSDPAYLPITGTLRATYTFGQPMIGSPALAEAAGSHDYFAERQIRYVYRRDVVPHLPPWGAGDFAHFGPEFRYSGSWRRSASPTGQMIPLGGLLVAAGDFVARQHRLLRLLPFQYSFNAHLPRHYISALTPPDRPSEFGDASLEPE